MSNYSKVVIHYTFTPESFIKIGAGYGSNSFIDNVQRHQISNSNVMLYEIPGTSVKGRIRANLEQIEHLLPNKVSNNIFGKSGTEGWAHFTSLVPNSEVKTGIMTSTAIDRFRKSSKIGALRVEEYMQIPSKTRFSGSIEGFIEKKLLVEIELYSLLLVLLRTQYFGGDKSIGFGKGKITITEAKIGDEIIEIASLEETIYQKLSE